MLESNKIIAFIKNNQEKSRTRWTDIEKEFCNNQGWSKGKFVNNWKDIKSYLEKRPTKNWKRGMYFVKKPWDKVAMKALLVNNAEEREVNKVNIPKEEMEKALIKLAETYRDLSIKQSSFLKGLKLL